MPDDSIPSSVQCGTYAPGDVASGVKESQVGGILFHNLVQIGGPVQHLFNSPTPFPKLPVKV